MIEHRFVEVRADPEERVLTGTAMPYGVVATLPWGLERFEPGAFAGVQDTDVILNAQHDRTAPLARTNGGGLLLVDTPASLTIRATLPETRAADDVLALVRGKVLRGLSVEFNATEDRYIGDTRIVARATLSGIGVVDSPAYTDAEVAALRAAFPPNADIAALRERQLSWWY